MFYDEWETSITIVSQGITTQISHREKTCFIYDFITTTFWKVSNQSEKVMDFPPFIFSSSLSLLFRSSLTSIKFFLWLSIIKKTFLFAFHFHRCINFFQLSAWGEGFVHCYTKKNLAQVSLPLTLPSSSFSYFFFPS